jgi:[ribosomal protein S5]-alanine N-acetyltransferase
MINLEEVETKRLLGRRIQPDDFHLFRELHQNSQVAETMGVRSEEEIREMFARHIDHWNRHGFGLWIWQSRADGKFVGRGGLHQVFVGGHDEVEVGYALMPHFWRQGLATEIAQAAIDVAVHRLGLADIVAFTLPTNLGSRRVMEKNGLQFERDIIWKDLPHVLYRLKSTS